MIFYGRNFYLKQIFWPNVIATLSFDGVVVQNYSRAIEQNLKFKQGLLYYYFGRVLVEQCEELKGRERSEFEKQNNLVERNGMQIKTNHTTKKQ